MLVKQILYRGRDDQGNVLCQPILGEATSYLEKTAAPQWKPSNLHPVIQRHIKDGTISKSEKGIYVLVSALGAAEYWGSNVNGDSFPEKSLVHSPADWLNKPLKEMQDIGKKWEYGYPTFMNAHPYKHHVNKDPSRAFGHVVLAVWNPRMFRVELVIFLDKELCKKHGAEDVYERIENGEFPDVSMGCKVPYDRCSICDHKSKTTKDYCFHAKNEMNRIYPDGRKVCVINDYPRFFDISFVFIGADKSAKMLAKLASVNDMVCMGDYCTIPRLSADLGERFSPTLSPQEELDAFFKEASLVDRWKEMSDPVRRGIIGGGIGLLGGSAIGVAHGFLRPSIGPTTTVAQALDNTAPDFIARNGQHIDDDALRSAARQDIHRTAKFSKTVVPGLQRTGRNFLAEIDLGRKDTAGRGAPIAVHGTWKPGSSIDSILEKAKAEALKVPEGHTKKAAQQKTAVSDRWVYDTVHNAAGKVSPERLDAFTKKMVQRARHKIPEDTAPFETKRSATIAQQAAMDQPQGIYRGDIWSKKPFVSPDRKPVGSWAPKTENAVAETVPDVMRSSALKKGLLIGAGALGTAYVGKKIYDHFKDKTAEEDRAQKLALAQWRRQKLGEMYGVKVSNTQFAGTERFPIEKRANDPIKEKLDVAGVPVWLEWKPGELREYKDKAGRVKFSKNMKHGYGYIPNTKDADGEEIDVYLGENRKSPKAWVIAQLKHDGKTFDENKVMMGFDSQADAKASYDHHMGGAKERFGGIKEVPVSALKALFGENGDGKEKSSGACDCDCGGSCQIGFDKVAEGFGQKSASHAKLSEITKIVPAGPFRKTMLPTLEKAEGDLPKETIEKMAEYGIPSALSTSASLGIVLKPHEFQRLILVKMGEANLAEELAAQSITLPPTTKIDDTFAVFDQSVVSEKLASELFPFVWARSIASTVLEKRASIALRIVGSERVLRSGQGELLEKIAELYNGYRQDLVKKAGRIDRSMVFNPHLSSAIGRESLVMAFAGGITKTAHASALGPESLAYLVGAHYEDREFHLEALAQSGVRAAA